ncbi:MAG: hypothetical protein FJ363_02675 [Gemmatimonadetes bacterium]|nr:hypothetical protein [Gemmatimonadota bacterium]
MSLSARACRSLAALVCGGLAAGCAPERVPGSTLSQGDAGIAFHRELASVRGAGAPRHGPGGASGASYGGGSSSATAVRSLGNDMPDLHLGAQACAWAVVAAVPGSVEAAPSPVERAKGAPGDEGTVPSCGAPAETR